MPAGPKKLCPAGILLITGIIGPPALGIEAIDPADVPPDVAYSKRSLILISLSPNRYDAHGSPFDNLDP